MEAKVIILPGGKIEILIDGANVSFEEARAKSAALAALLGVANPQIRIDSQPEQHKPDGLRHAHIVDTVGHSH